MGLSPEELRDIKNDARREVGIHEGTVEMMWDDLVDRFAGIHGIDEELARKLLEEAI